MKVGDKIKLTGNGWENWAGAVVPLKQISGVVGQVCHPGNGYLYSVTLSDPKDYWGAIPVESAPSLPASVAYFFEKPIDIANNPTWWALHKDKIVEEAKEEAASVVRHQYQEWPYNKDLQYVISLEQKTIKFYWAERAE